jgi:AraC family transcriptional regulator
LAIPEPASALTARAPGLRLQTGAPAMDAALWRGVIPEITNFVRGPGLTTLTIRAPHDAPVRHEAEVAEQPEHALLMFRRPVPHLDVTLGGSRRTHAIPPRGFVAVPIGSDSLWRSTWGEVDLLQHVHVDEALFRAATADRPQARFPTLFGVSDARLLQIVEVAAGLGAAETMPGRLVWESCGVLLVHHLLRLAGSDRGRATARGGLAGWQVRRTTDYVAAHLAENIGLTELAAIAGLSPFHFARAFKQSVGDPPHRYQTRRRIERACELLTTTDMPVIDIAAAVGFEAPQTLTRLFRRELGMTPSAYRRDVRR